MATVSLKTAGLLTGKIGPVILTTWRGKQVLRSKPVYKKDRVFSQAQLDQQEKFKLINRFFRGIEHVIHLSFKYNKNGRAALQEAIAQNFKHITKKDEQSFGISFEKIMIAQGGLPLVTDMNCEVITPHQLKLTWNDTTKNAHAADRIVVVFYNESDHVFLNSGDHIRRSEQELVMDVSLCSGKEVHGWFFFISENKKQVSDSVYLGYLSV